ncbi:MAG: family peptidase [Clostridia bacterium]|nr:family peptidase [Clostridia bacterium]
MEKPELMAPAGNSEALKAAIANGADAIYLGGKSFNAREGAENFNEDEIINAINYAHERDVRVYVTVNILLADEEIPKALDYLHFLANARVDGVIIQDLGLAYWAKRLLPDLPLIGSTQMTVTNAAGARYLEEKGFKRVVLGRELSLEDIRDIYRQVKLELEAFVHGALCYSYSGQCLFSSMVGGRSGNRGRCAQPCRLSYTLVDDKNKNIELKPEHLLSTRDLYTLDLVPRLIEAGVKSFKIEGRMRRAEYVGVVTRAYRQVIDRYLSDPRNFKVSAEEETAVAQIFNRDFTPGYLKGDPGAELMGYGRPNNRGLYLGRVGRRLGKRYKVNLEAPLYKGDGLNVWVSRGGHQGVVVNKIWLDNCEVTSAPAGSTVMLELPSNSRTGDRIFKTSDIKLLKDIRCTYTSSKEDRSIPLTFTVKAKPGEPLYLEVTDPKGNRAEAYTAVNAEVAKRHPLNEDVLSKQLGRLGNTPYRLERVISHLESPVMVPLSELNKIRRDVIEELREKRLASWPKWVSASPDFKGKLKKITKKIDRNKIIEEVRPRLAVAVGDADGVRAALAAGAERIYLTGEVWRGNVPLKTEDYFELANEVTKKGAEFIPALPRLWHEKEAKQVTAQLERIMEAGISTVLVANLGGLKLLKDKGIKGWGDYSLNIFNSSTVEALMVEGLQGVTLSPEMKLEQIQDLKAELPLEVIVHGALPLMISAHCVLGARLGGKKLGQVCNGPCLKGKYSLKDRLNLVFPVNTDRNCRFYLYNAKELTMIDHLGKIKVPGLNWVRLEIREKSPKYINRITGIYRKALASLGMRNEGEILAAAVEEVKALAPKGITRGHYFRGVI